MSVVRLRQGEIFRSASGPCPYCGTEQRFMVMGTFRLPKQLHCKACHRQLMLEGATT
jgi:RNase P subunit RPR2